MLNKVKVNKELYILMLTGLNQKELIFEEFRVRKLLESSNMILQSSMSQRLDAIIEYKKMLKLLNI